MNVSFIFRTFRSIFKFLATYEATFDPQKGQKNSKIERNVRKMNATFFLKPKKERRERNVHFQWTEMNVENETFIFNERKWTQERNVLLKRTDAQPCVFLALVETVQYVVFSDFKLWIAPLTIKWQWKKCTVLATVSWYFSPWRWIGSCIRL